MQQCEWITDLIKKYLLNGVHKKGIQRNNHIVELSINYTNWTTIQTTNSVTTVYMRCTERFLSFKVDDTNWSS